MSKQVVCQTLVLGLLLAWPAGSPADELKPTSPIGPGYRLAWHDEFDSERLDTGKWTYRIDTRFWSVQLAENVSVADGCLRLALKKEKRGEFDYTAGGVISREAFQYGYYEARFRDKPDLSQTRLPKTCSGRCDRRILAKALWTRRWRARRIALVSVLTARLDELQWTSQVRLATHRNARRAVRPERARRRVARWAIVPLLGTLYHAKQVQTR